MLLFLLIGGLRSDASHRAMFNRMGIDGRGYHLRPILDKLGIPRAGIHAFRHFSATLMDRLSVPLKAREARLGHSSSALTLGTYTHVVSADDERFAAKMGEILCPDLPQVPVSDTKENNNSPNSVGA